MKLLNKEAQNSIAKLSDKHNSSPVLFRKSKKVPKFWKKDPDCVHLWVKFFIRNLVLTVSWRSNSKIFSSRVFLSCVFDEMFIEMC